MDVGFRVANVRFSSLGLGFRASGIGLRGLGFRILRRFRGLLVVVAMVVVVVL